MGSPHRDPAGHALGALSQAGSPQCVCGPDRWTHPGLDSAGRAVWDGQLDLGAAIVQLASTAIGTVGITPGT
jgi:hypothetical protein